MTQVGNPMPKRLRILLILGRVSNLPTVWSNCLVGWWLGRGASISELIQLCISASLLYLSGMYLNDVFDAEFDRRHRPERPIPAGSIEPRTVWQLGAIFMVAGIVGMGLLGTQPLIWAIVLAATIIVYNACHKTWSHAPLLMALCRCLLVLAAGSTTDVGIEGRTAWIALSLTAYVIGLSYLARLESTGGDPPWPLALIAAPVVYSLIINNGATRLRGLAFAAILVLWVVFCLRSTLGSPPRNYGKTVAGLLAGIVLVDMLAILGGTPEWTIALAFLFLVSLVMQRFIPAT